MKSDSDLVSLFSALAHPWRIAILRVLLRHAVSGRQFGALSKDLGISPSTLTHHLQEMENAGILSRETMGRATLLRLDLTILTEVASQLAGLCCSAEIQPPTQIREARE